MKSVVVEAATVAKAIELAWQKAEKPEEFFIRILQEHQFGFLGFGAQKAKIVLFFKNSQKSDSLFPVLLKQKEYANLFDNQQLKNPQELNVVDSELNKHIVLQSKSFKKKQQHQEHDVKNKQSHDLAHQQNSVKKNKQEQILQQGITQEKIQIHKAKQHAEINQVTKSSEQQIKSVEQNKSQPLQKNQKQKPQVQVKQIEHKKIVSDHLQDAKVKNKHIDKQVVAQKKDISSVTQEKVVEDKEIKSDIVADIAKALKQVQSQKIVAQVSKPIRVKQEEITKKQQEQNIKQVVENEEQLLKKDNVAQVAIEQKNQTKPLLKFKRRPLKSDEERAQEKAEKEQKLQSIVLENKE
ncbi:MAG: Jag N-terminal domain-containing protein [Candidatus Chromulinivorax sp.]